MKECSADITCTSVQGGKVPTKSSVSDDEKTMHPQCITERSVDGALKRAKSPSGAIDEGDAGLLADEVERLRSEVGGVIRLTTLLLGIDAEKTVAALQEWDTEMPKLRAKLANAESIAAFSLIDPLGVVPPEQKNLARSVLAALRDPQPAAAPTPKGEPYNGW